jgi:pullulanase
VDADLLKRRTTHFTLWGPEQHSPQLAIGAFKYGAPPSIEGLRTLDLSAVAGLTDLWHIAAADCGLQDGSVYHYWFEVDDTRPGSKPGTRVRVTDPVTSTPDWRVQEADGEQPASVIKFQGGQLVACDQDGTPVISPATDNPGGLAPNNFTIIYELPTAWMRQPRGDAERGVGTFRDIVAMLDPNAQAPNFDELGAAQKGRAHIAELGINAIELLPPADSYYARQWGYGTSHMCAPDSEMGQPDFNSWSTANADLRRLAETCHSLGIRFIDDVVMAFARSGSYERIAFDDFHIAIDYKHPDPNDPDVWNSRSTISNPQPRQNFGSTLWRFVRQTTTYDPVSGNNATLVPARSLHFVAQERWMTDFHIDGYRIDSVENVANWDFLGTFTSNARDRFRARCVARGLSQNDADARFLVVGEELNLPIDIIRQGRITALWNDNFREYLRCAVLGQNAQNENFESTVNKMVDCRSFGFSDMAESVNYIGSHDVEGKHKERIATTFRYQFPHDDPNFDDNNQIGRRVKLAFACLLTAVGIPMILAGDEFADENDLFDIKGEVDNNAGKQIDPVDFNRLEGDDNAWRRDVLSNVKNLIQNRKTHASLGVNNTKWLHSDFTPGRRIMVWQRGTDDNPVVVVANFSDFQTNDPFNPSSEYVVPNWPRPNDFAWKEVSLNRNVAAGWIGREPLFPWEAKVYVHQ